MSSITKTTTTVTTEVINQKKCSACQQFKEYEFFGKNKRNRDGLASDCKLCRVNEKRTYREKYAKKVAEADRLWQLANPVYVKLKNMYHSHRVRALQYGVVDELIGDRAWWHTLLERDGGVCLVCGTTENLSADHVIPMSLGGPHSLDNLQILCRSHNAKKHTQAWDFRNYEWVDAA